MAFLRFTFYLPLLIFLMNILNSFPFEMIHEQPVTDIVVCLMSTTLNSIWEVPRARRPMGYKDFLLFREDGTVMGGIPIIFLKSKMTKIKRNSVWPLYEHAR